MLHETSFWSKHLIPAYKKIKDIFPKAKQVRELGLENATDDEIFEFAGNNKYSIVTFNSFLNEDYGCLEIIDWHVIKNKHDYIL